MRIGDRIAVMSPGGHVEQFAAPAELLGRPANLSWPTSSGPTAGSRRLAVTGIDVADLERPPVVKVDDCLADARAAMDGRTPAGPSSSTRGRTERLDLRRACTGAGTVYSAGRRMEAWVPVDASLKAFSTMLQTRPGGRGPRRRPVPRRPHARVAARRAAPLRGGGCPRGRGRGPRLKPGHRRDSARARRPPAEDMGNDRHASWQRCRPEDASVMTGASGTTDHPGRGRRTRGASAAATSPRGAGDPDDRGHRVSPRLRKPPDRGTDVRQYAGPHAPNPPRPRRSPGRAPPGGRPASVRPGAPGRSATRLPTSLVRLRARGAQRGAPSPFGPPGTRRRRAPRGARAATSP